MNSSPSLPPPDAAGGASVSLAYTVGVDLGQSVDPTAIAIIRTLRFRDSFEPIVQVGHLERLPLNTPYPGVVTRVGNLLTRLPQNSELVIDFTGVGRPVFEMFDARGMAPIGVTITAGDAVVSDGRVHRVPKLILISQLQALLHSGRLKIQRDMADAQALVAELQDFRAEVTDAGYWRFGARAGKHDDLVLALAIAVWRAVGLRTAGMGVFEFVRETVNGAQAHQEAAPPMVTVRLPAGHDGAMSARLLSGRLAYARPDRTIEATMSDAAPLLAAGWTLVEAEPASELE